jgi:uncharacterized protein (DUF2141 family)
LRISLYDKPEGFPVKVEKALTTVFVPVGNAASTVYRFEGLPKGRYAISVVHDENANRKLDTGLFGIPSEGLGASNNPKGSFGPPSFDAAAFGVDGKDVTLKIKVAYI